MNKIIVIGGGPAGMFAAIAAAEAGSQVTLLEKNEKLGKKLYITGVIDFFERNGLRTKIERGNRVFPVSDHSSDVIATLQKVLKEKKVKIMLHTQVQSLLEELSVDDISQNVVTGVKLEDGTTMQADAVIVATGGFSYQTTGYPSVACSLSCKRGICAADAGTGFKKCRSAYFKWKEIVISGVRRDVVYAFWRQRTIAFVGKCGDKTVSYGRRTFHVYRSKAGT